MINILRDPIWQGLGVLVCILLGFVGFYHTQKQKIWLYLASFLIVLILGVSIGTGLQKKSLPSRTQNPTQSTTQRELQSSEATSVGSILSGVSAYKTPDEVSEKDFNSVLSLNLNPFGELGYTLDYSFPMDTTRFYAAGISFFIAKMRNISEYNQLCVTINAEPNVDFVIAVNDTDGTKDDFTATGIGRDQTINIPIKSTFTKIKLNSVFGIHFIVTTSTRSSRGSHRIFITDIKLMK